MAAPTRCRSWLLLAGCTVDATCFSIKLVHAPSSRGQSLGSSTSPRPPWRRGGCAARCRAVPPPWARQTPRPAWERAQQLRQTCANLDVGSRKGAAYFAVHGCRHPCTARLETLESMIIRRTVMPTWRASRSWLPRPSCRGGTGRTGRATPWAEPPARPCRPSRAAWRPSQPPWPACNGKQQRRQSVAARFCVSHLAALTAET